MEQEHDPLFAERGISPTRVTERGYKRWNSENSSEVIGEAYELLHQGGVDWLCGVVQEVVGDGEVSGIVITRHSPFEIPGQPLLPEIRPDSAVKTGHARRHFHAPCVDKYVVLEGVRVLWSALMLLPSFVQKAVCIPQLGGWYKLRFTHEHAGLSPEELLEHERDWHRNDAGLIPKHKKVHQHNLSIAPADLMADHIGDEEPSKKITEEHLGVNSLGIHKHAPLAKYLFPPSPSEEGGTWNTDQHHSHDHMTDEQYEWHLERYHAAR